MKFFQLTITALLKKDTHFTESSEVIGNSINRAMLKDQELMKFHREKVYKYVFDNFYPLEKEGVYKANRIYIFKIRSINEDFILRIKKCLKDFESVDIKVVAEDLDIIAQRAISFIETVTPAIITVDNQPWLKEGDLLTLVKRLHDNAEKKYKYFYNEDIGEVEDYFIEKLRIINKTPCVYRYKNIKLLANKFKIKVNEDEKSQKLAFVTVACGLA